MTDIEMELRHLRLIATIAEEGTLTAAAERLHLTQSALSHQLSDAEERLGTRLFVRARRMQLTGAGERLLTAARTVFTELGNAQIDIRKMIDGDSGLIRLCAECDTCYNWLPRLLKRFQAKFPRVEVRIQVEATDRIVEALLEGKLEVAVMSSAPRNKAFSVEPLFQDQLMLLMAPQHRLARRPYVRAHDFKDEHLLVYPPKEESSLIRELLKPAGVKLKSVTEVPLTEAMIEMVKADLGICVLARWAADAEIRSGCLLARPVTASGRWRQWSAVALRRNAQLPHIRHFVETLAAQQLPQAVEAS